MAPGGATIVGAGADVVLAGTVPMVTQLLFAVRYVGAPDELTRDTQHPFSCRIFDPAGKQIGEQGGSLSAESTQIVRGYVAELTVPLAIVLEVTQYGTYHFEFVIDDSDKRVPMHIVSPDQLNQ
ncbi:MAG TPA: hypothetical protein VGL78_10930 [Solirubrobacteraceae bacterium]|jgi:hypothetical protein